MRLDLYRSPEFSASGFAALVALFALVGTGFLLSIYLGGTQHLAPLEIAERMLFLNGVTGVASPFVGRLIGRVAPIAVLSSGLLLGTFAVVLLTGVHADTGFVDLAWRLTLLGLAQALMLSAVSVAAIQSVPHALAGMAAAANTALRQTGAALGPAVLGVVFTERVAGGSSTTAALHTGMVVNAVLLVVALAACLASMRLQAGAMSPVASPVTARR